MPPVEGAPRNDILRRFGQFIDGVEAYHRSLGDVVTVETRALWQFGFDEMQDAARTCDRIYFPHKLRSQFPIGPTAVYYKNSPLFGLFTADPQGWGASLSFLPPARLPDEKRIATMKRLHEQIAGNQSIFAQPALKPVPIDAPYLLFLCQLPHDETIRFHANVSVEAALEATIRYAEHCGTMLVVKGHPANRRSMEPLRALAARSAQALWVDDLSIHSCLAGAERVFLVNSGSGMEAMLHDRPVIRFGHAEYDSVTPMAEPTLASLIGLENYRHSSSDYEGFLAAFADRCIDPDDAASYAHVLG